MKNKYIYILTLLLVFLGTSCSEEFLNIIPADQPVLEDYYKNEDQIRAATASLYSRPWFGFNDKFSWAAGDGMAGDLYQDYLDEGQLFFFSYSDKNSIISQAWQSLYNVVSYSNAIIADMPRVAGGNGVSEEVINAALGEARFMRANAYFFLSEFWGAVPIVENTADLIKSGIINLPRNSQASVYEFIRRDLVFAAEHLPSSDEGGRVTEWSAKGMLAKLHLTLGYFANSAADFDLARDYAQDVITNSGASLMENYEDLFKIENNNNSESLFAFQWHYGKYGIGNSRQAVFGRSPYVTGNTEAWGGGKSVTQNFIDNLNANAGSEEDLRRPWIYMVEGDHYPNIAKADGGYTYNILVEDPDGGNDLEYAAPLLNNIKKYIVGSQADVGLPVDKQAVSLNQYILRLSDVYLIYAEAVLANGASTTDATALQYFNAVRDRAGLNDKTTLNFTDIFNERRVEFGIEGLNWLDVKRRFYKDEAEAISYINGQERASRYRLPEGFSGDRTNPDNYNFEPADPPVSVVADNFYLPIPSNETDVNPLLKEEPVPYDFSE